MDSLGIVVIEVQSGSSTFVRKGWQNVLESIGYTCHQYWVDGPESIHDFWNRIGKVDIFLGTTYNLNRPLIKQIQSRPEMKVALYCSGWGLITDTIDRVKYPIQIVSEEEKKLVEQIKDRISFVHIHTNEGHLKYYIGGWTDNLGIPTVSIMNGADLFVYSNAKPTQQYEAEISLVGGCWNYKSINLNKSIIRLCREHWQKYKIKIYGQGWDVPQYVGSLPIGEDAHVFASSKICPNISEPHSTDIFCDLIERIFKVPIANGFLISDNAIGLDDIFPKGKCPIFNNFEEFKELIDFYLRPENGLLRLHLMREQKQAVWRSHTYFERVAKMLYHLGFVTESIECCNERKTKIFNCL